MRKQPEWKTDNVTKDAKLFDFYFENLTFLPGMINFFERLCQNTL